MRDNLHYLSQNTRVLCLRLRFAQYRCSSSSKHRVDGFSRSCVPDSTQTDAFTPSVALPAGKPVHLLLHLRIGRIGRSATQQTGSRLEVCTKLGRTPK